jgi:hypothetical protein
MQELYETLRHLSGDSFALLPLSQTNQEKQNG